MYKFAEERFDDVIAEMLPLLKEHYLEISANQDIPLAIDMQRYQKLQEQEILRIYIARDEMTDELIGYAAYFVAPNLHYMTSLQATQDVVYISPKRRGFGQYFINQCDDELRKLGVQVVYHHVKTAFNWGKMLLRLKYRHVEEIYSRRLDKES